MLHECHKNLCWTKSKLFNLNSNCGTEVNGGCAGFELLQSCSVHPGGVVGSKTETETQAGLSWPWLGGLGVKVVQSWVIPRDDGA